MKILAAVDLSKASGYVIEAVHRVAMATDAEVYLLHVVIPLPSFASPEFHPVTEHQEVTERYLDEQDQLDELVTQLGDVSIRVEGLLLQGDPVRIVLREAERLDAELIVVGSHGHGPLFDALVGSVSSGILQNASVPVLVVPTKGH